MTEISESASDRLVGAFLVDIQVWLGLERPTPRRLVFPEFAPHFARIRDLPLSDHLVEAYRATHDENQRALIRQLVVGALYRCACTVLGGSRGLVVIDVVHAIAPEVWTDALWSKLLFRQTRETDLGRWISAVVLRWSQWNSSVELPLAQMIDAVRQVEPRSLKMLVEYALAQLATPDTKSTVAKAEIVAAARLRVKTEAVSFAHAEVDCAEIGDFLDRVAQRTYPELDLLAWDDGEREATVLKSDLNRHWGVDVVPWGIIYSDLHLPEETAAET